MLHWSEALSNLGVFGICKGAGCFHLPEYAAKGTEKKTATSCILVPGSNVPFIRPFLMTSTSTEESQRQFFVRPLQA